MKTRHPVSSNKKRYISKIKGRISAFYLAKIHFCIMCLAEFSMLEQHKMNRFKTTGADTPTSEL